MASGMRTGRSSNRITLQVGRGSEWSPGSVNWMTPGGLVFCALPKKRSSLLRRVTSIPASSRSITNCSLNSTKPRRRNLAGGYLLRTNVADWTDEELWKAYIQLTEAKSQFPPHTHHKHNWAWLRRERSASRGEKESSCSHRKIKNESRSVSAIVTARA